MAACPDTALYCKSGLSRFAGVPALKALIMFLALQSALIGLRLMRSHRRPFTILKDVSGAIKPVRRSIRSVLNPSFNSSSQYQPQPCGGGVCLTFSASNPWVQCSSQEHLQPRDPSQGPCDGSLTAHVAAQGAAQLHSILLAWHA